MSTPRRVCYGAEDGNLHGHANIRANVCFLCNGKLKAADGSHCEMFYDDGVVAFGAAICRTCKDAEIAQKTASTKSTPKH